MAYDDSQELRLTAHGYVLGLDRFEIAAALKTTPHTISHRIHEIRRVSAHTVAVDAPDRLHARAFLADGAPPDFPDPPVIGAAVPFGWKVSLDGKRLECDSQEQAAIESFTRAFDLGPQAVHEAIIRYWGSDLVPPRFEAYLRLHASTRQRNLFKRAKQPFTNAASPASPSSSTGDSVSLTVTPSRSMNRWMKTLASLMRVANLSTDDVARRSGHDVVHVKRLFELDGPQPTLRVFLDLAQAANVRFVGMKSNSVPDAFRWVNELRQHTNLSNTELASRTGMNRSHLSSIFNGKRPSITLETFDKILIVLGIGINARTNLILQHNSVGPDRAEAQVDPAPMQPVTSAHTAHTQDRPGPAANDATPVAEQETSMNIKTLQADLKRMQDEQQPTLVLQALRRHRDELTFADVQSLLASPLGHGLASVQIREIFNAEAARPSPKATKTIKPKSSNVKTTRRARRRKSTKPRSGRVPQVSALTREGRRAYDDSIVDVLQKGGGWHAPRNIRAIAGGTESQFSSAIHRLIAAGRVAQAGKFASAKYAVKKEA